MEIDPQASDAEILAAVTACRQLKLLVLRGPVCRVFKSQTFQYTACHSKLETLYYMAAGLRVTQNMIRSTMDSLVDGQTIFNHLTILHTGMDGAAAKELFPRMPTITELTLYVDRNDDIVQWLSLLTTLSLKARADVSLTPFYLRGLRNLHLVKLDIGGERSFAFNGLMISVDDIDTIFGSHGTLRDLEVAWRGDTVANPTFLQHSPELLLERVITHYPALRHLDMPIPCGPLDLRRMPFAPLNSDLESLCVDHLVAPRTDRIMEPAE